MDTKERKKSALEEVKRTIARRNTNILKGQVGDGAISNPVYRMDIMEEVRALSSIKKMDNSTISKVKQSGTVNIRSGINNAKSSLNRSASKCRKAKTPSIKSVVFKVKGINIGSNKDVGKQLMMRSGGQTSSNSKGVWIPCGRPPGKKRKYFVWFAFIKNSWVESEGKRYYIGSDEYMVTGWKKIDGHYYYFESNIKNGKETAGYMVTYWHDIKGKRYYFGSNGVRVTSKVIDWNGKKYYVGKNGVMAVNKTIVDPDSGKTYNADEKGELTEGAVVFVEIAPWLKGYNGKPSASGGRRVTYSLTERQKLKEIDGVINIDWYSFENQTGPNVYTKPYLKNKQFNLGTYGELTDENGRYWITLGPKVLIPSYPNDGKLNTKEFADYIGCRIDVVLHNTKEKKYAYIECVFSGDIKAHTYKNGIYQTGHPYPNSYSAKQEPYEVGYVDGSIVEFTGKNPSSNGSMSRFTVVELVVYPK